MSKLITVRGIGEPMDNNELSGLVRALAPTEHVELAYPAQYGPVPVPLGYDFETTSAVGRRLLLAELDKGPAGVAGFSAGARVAGDVAAAGHPNLRFTGLVADPCMPDLGNGHSGIAGARPITRGLVHWEANPADIICQTPNNSPLRTIADQTSAMSFANLEEWGAELIGRLRTERWQKVVIPWNDPLALWRMYSEAIVGAEAYLGDHVHPAYGVTRVPGRSITYIDDLIAWMRPLMS